MSSEGSERRGMVAAPMFFVDPGPVEDETAAKSRLRFNRDITAVLAKNILAHRQAQPRSACDFCRLEDVEDLRKLVLRNARPIVGNGDETRSEVGSCPVSTIT